MREETARAMKIWSSSAWVVGSAAISIAALLLSPLLSQRARAYGGLWSSQSSPIDQTAEEIIFVDNGDSTVTAVVKIEYAGPPQKFAWLIPVPGTPTVGFSSSTVFERLDAATAPQYWLEVAVMGTCKKQDAPAAGLDAGSGTAGGPGAAGTTASPIGVIDQGSVGPYDYVNLLVDPTLDDPAAVATDWLSMNGYDLTDLDSKVLSPYLKAGLNLLAFKLQSSADTGAIRPVTLTYESKLPMIPIRPTAVAAQGDMGMKIWVIGPSRAVPKNYESVAIDDARIDWLSVPKYIAGTLPAGGAGMVDPYATAPSNYDAVVTAAVSKAGGRGFVTELGAPASQFRDKVWSTTDEQQLAMISSQGYTDGIDAILAASTHYGGWDGWKEAIEGATTLPPDVTVDELSHNPEQYRGVAVVDTQKFLQLLDERVVRPVADTAALLYGAPYLTRLYSTMSAEAMTVDPVFGYKPDLTQVSNVHIAKQVIECRPNLTRDDAPWHIELPQSGHANSTTPSRSNQCSVSRVGSDGAGSALALGLPLVGFGLALRQRRVRR
ncbi:MAG: DUF2330 domain-containing protein [Polyangiales bacterium]